MNTKIIYVVVANETNYYLEQALISILSLRKTNCNPDVYVVTDKISEIYISTHPRFKEVGKINIISIDVPSKYNNKQKSRFLKTNLRNYISGDYLFVDTDTVFVDDISDVDSFKFSIAAVLDKHLPVSRHLFKDDIIKFSKKFKWDILKCEKYFNSGIMYVKDNDLAKEFYNRWFKYWENGADSFKINIDQPSMAKANEESNYIISEINGIYNCQINENGLKYFFNSKIIHYFASNLNNRISSTFTIGSNEFFKTFRENGLTTDLELLLSDPKSAFNETCTIIGGDQCAIYRSPFMRLSIKLSNKLPFLNEIFRKIALIRTIGK